MALYDADDCVWVSLEKFGVFDAAVPNARLSGGGWLCTGTNLTAPLWELFSSDHKAINAYMRGFCGAGCPRNTVSPGTVTMTSENTTSSKRLWDELAIDLTVEPGYNMTLSFKSFRVPTGCTIRSAITKL